MISFIIDRCFILNFSVKLTNVKKLSQVSFFAEKRSSKCENCHLLSKMDWLAFALIFP